MKDIATIVVTFNRKTLLRECLKAIFAQRNADTDVILVDNCSTDGTKEYVADILSDQRIHYFRTKRNIGGAGGFHFGLKKAVEMGYQHYWLMDDDSIPDPDALYEILQADKKLKGEYGFLCSNVRWTDGSACQMNIPDIPKNWLNSAHYVKDEIIPVERATFVGFFISRPIVIKVGLPIKEFFIWSDDSNYCLRIQKEAESYAVIRSRIVHKTAVNTGASILTDTSGRDERYFYAFRNRYYNARMIHKLSSYWMDVFKTALLILIRTNNKQKKLYYMFKGALAGIWFNPEIEYIRDGDSTC